MNVNNSAPLQNLNKNKRRQIKAVPIQRKLMGPPKRPAPKRREFSNSAYTTNSSSHIQWKSQERNNIGNNSATVVHTTSTSRSRSSTEPESRVILALSEGRGEAIGEVGIAAINLAHPSLVLCQISDSQSYINTLTKINILNPSEILIPLTFIESFSCNRLIEKVKEKFQDVKITGVPRSTFNQNNGLQYIRQLCVPSMDSILLFLQHRYYALAAAAALLTYTETTLFIIYASESIKIEYQESEGSTIIDVATADGLELVASARPSMKKRFSCLLDILNHCITKIGARTLRASILQPPCSVPDIEARLDCVSELIGHADMLTAIQASLMKLVNIDHLLGLATILPDQAQNCSERQLNYILTLNITLEQINPLRCIFENSEQPFFIELRNTLSNPAFTEIKNLVRTLIHNDAWPAKGQYGIIQRCFAIKSGVNSLLDLLRKSYSERLDDMREYVRTLGEKHSLALTLNNTHKKGYHILLTLNAHQKRTLKKSDLPLEFIQVERLPTCYTMKTQDLINLSHRVEDMMLEILKMSNIMIFRLLIQIREYVAVFYKLCEDIAHLDMLQSLAKASSAIHYVRPRFSDHTEIKHSRHPLLDFLCSTEPIANSVFVSQDHNMNIITGPNGSGKSIFIRQIVLIQVMAQVGCYVPAYSATLKVSDRILAKVYLEDNMDCGASAFVLEMKEIQYILNVLTDNSLIIIDELCRSTSVEEGTALAMAICEKLMKMSAFLFFTTHFKFMTKLENLHYNIKTWQMETLTDIINDQMILQFTYNVIPGVTALEHYGIFLAKTSWPENIIRYAEEILKKLSKSQKNLSSHFNKTNEAARLKYNLEAEFKLLKAKGQLTQLLINDKLAEYKEKLENLGYQVDQLYITPFNMQENNNDANILETSKNIQIEDLSQILNTQMNTTDIFQQDNACKGFGLHAKTFKNIENSSNDNSTNQRVSFSDVSNNINAFETSAELHNNLNLSDISWNTINAPINFEDVNNPLKGQHYDQSSPAYHVNLKNSEILQCFPDFNADTSNDLFEVFPINNLSFQDSYDGITQNLNIFSNYEGINDTLRSNFNIFEPEIILETRASQLNINFTNVKDDALTLQQVTQNNSVTSIENSISSIKIHENTAISKHLMVIEENSFLSEDNSFYFSKSNDVFFENAISNFAEHNHTSHSNKQSNDAESVLSVNEQQFSLPLQQNIERTSTPLQIYSQPISSSKLKQTINNYRNQTSKPSEYQSKSASSNTINWGLGKMQNILSTPTLTSPKASKQIHQINLEKSSSPVKSVSASEKSSLNPNIIFQQTEINEQQLQSNSDSIEWNVRRRTQPTFRDSKALKKNNCNKLSNWFKKQSNYNSSKSEEQKGTKYADNMVPKANSGDSSILLINEHQFSLQNVRKTSTPLNIKIQPHSQPASLKQKQISNKQKNSNQGKDCTVRGVEQPSKSTSTNSDSIKWKIIGKPAVSASSSAETVQKSKLISTDSIKWTVVPKTNPDQTHSEQLIGNEINPVDKQQSTNNELLSRNNCETSIISNVESNLESNNSFHYFAAEITEVIDDLQNCSEYFTDCEEHWNTLDEETNRKLREINKSKNELFTSQTDTEENENSFQAISQKASNKESREINTIIPDSKEKCGINEGEISNIQMILRTKETYNENTSCLLENQIEFLENIELDEIISNNKNQKDVKEQSKTNSLLSNNQNGRLPEKCTQENQLSEVKDLNEDKECDYCQIIGSVHCHGVGSLEPLGDIHLELFNNESILDEDNDIDNSKDSQKETTNHEGKQNQDVVAVCLEPKNSKFANLNMTCSQDVEGININEEKQNNSKQTNNSFSNADIIGTSQDETNLDLLSKQSICRSSKHEENISVDYSSIENQQKVQNSSSYDKNTSTNLTFSPQSKKRKLSNNNQSTSNEQNQSYNEIETQSSNLFQVSPSSSDFEIPDDKSHSKKKKRWIPPFKKDSNTPTRQKTQNKKKRKFTKFNPPRELTKKEIEQEFYQQDKKMLESGDSAQYIQQLLSRPSVKQLRETKHIMSIHKTSSGVVIVPTKHSKPKLRKRSFVTPLKCRPADCDVTLFSDKNLDKYEEIMKKTKEEELINIRQDIVYQRIESEIVRKNNSKTSKSSEESSSSERCGEVIKSFKTEFFNEEKNKNLKQSEGYYSQNKKYIDDIIDKYLNPALKKDDDLQKSDP